MGRSVTDRQDPDEEGILAGQLLDESDRELLV